MAEKYWLQELDVNHCIEKIEKENKLSETSPEFVFRLLQKSLMTDNLEFFLEGLCSNFDAIL